MPTLHESDVENFAIELLQKQGYAYLSPEEQALERTSLSEVALHDRLKAAITNLNPDLPAGVKEQALRQVTALSSQNLVESNETFYRMLANEVVSPLFEKMILNFKQIHTLKNIHTTLLPHLIHGKMG